MADDRAISSSAAAFGFILIIIFSAFFLPAVVDDPSEDRTFSLNQTETETITVYTTLNATVDDVNNGGQEVTVTLTDSDTGATNQSTIANDTTTTLTLEGSQIDITVEMINSPTTAELKYTYPTNYAWPSGTKFIGDNLGVIGMALVLFVLVVGLIIE